MSQEQPNNPLHGITLKVIVTELSEFYGWDGLAERIDLRCFKFYPSINSTLKFLRKTPWAREKVEKLFLKMKKKQAKNAAKKEKRVDPYFNAGKDPASDASEPLQ